MMKFSAMVSSFLRSEMALNASRTVNRDEDIEFMYLHDALLPLQ